jgi:hypothetical protein
VEAQANTANRSKAQESSPWPRETAFGVRNEQHHWSSMRHSNSDLGMVVFFKPTVRDVCLIWKWCSIFYMFCLLFVGEAGPAIMKLRERELLFCWDGCDSMGSEMDLAKPPEMELRIEGSQPHDSSSQGSGMSNIDSIAILTGDRWWHMALLLFPWEDSDPTKMAVGVGIVPVRWSFGGW